MDAVGVDGAIFVNSFSMYRYDSSYALEVHKAHPGKFGLVKPVDPDDPAVADVIADWKATPGTVGLRIMLSHAPERPIDDPGYDLILREAARHDFRSIFSVGAISTGDRTDRPAHGNPVCARSSWYPSAAHAAGAPEPWEDLPKCSTSPSARTS